MRVNSHLIQGDYALLKNVDGTAILIGADLKLTSGFGMQRTTPFWIVRPDWNVMINKNRALAQATLV